MRIVIKIGTSTLTHHTGRMNIRRVEDLCKVISDLKNAGHEIIMVSSGAIGMGVGKLSLKTKPDDIPTKQAAAAIGQCELMYVYDREFSRYNHLIAQILLTNENVNDPVAYDNFHNTVTKLLEFGVLPILNENDTIATDEIQIGDNDMLGAIAASSLRADLLIILTDIEGLFDKDPRKDEDAELITEVHEITEDIVNMGGNRGSLLGTGGMSSKITAAKYATEAGVDVIIANGKDPMVLYEIVKGNPIGTKFFAEKK